MQDIVNRDTLLALASESKENAIPFPNDIENGEDFIAWCRRIDSHPHTPGQIQAAMEAIGEDENGCLNADLMTASRTFYKGTDVLDILDWLESAYGS